MPLSRHSKLDRQYGESFKGTLIKGSIATASQHSVHSANTVMLSAANSVDLDL